MRKLRKPIQGLILRLLPNIGRVINADSPETVVLVHLENLGDFILFSAVIRETRMNFPDSKLVVVGQRENRSVVSYCHLVDEWVWIRGHWKPKPGESTGRETSYFFKVAATYIQLLLKYRRKIDLLIGPDWLLTKNAEQFRSNILFKKANIRGGFANRYLRFDAGKYIAFTHQVPRNLSVLEMFGLKVTDQKTQTWVLSEESNFFKKDMSIRLDAGPKIVISLGAGHARRNYPPKALTEVVSRIHMARPEVCFVVIGPKSLNTTELDNLFSDLPNTQNLIGKTDIRLAAEIISGATMVIVNDSGFAHLAASLEIVTLVISTHPLDADPWHLHSPNRYHPWMTEYIALQPPHLLHPCVGSCQAQEPHCIEAVLVEDVLMAALSLLDKTNK